MDKSKKYSYFAASFLTVYAIVDLYTMVYVTLAYAKANSENFFVSFFKRFIWRDGKNLSDFDKNLILYNTIMLFAFLLIGLALFCRSRLFLLIDFCIVFLAFTLNFINWLVLDGELKKEWTDSINGYKVAMMVFAFASLLVALFLILSSIGLLLKSNAAIVFSAFALVIAFARLVFDVLMDIIPIYIEKEDNFFIKLVDNRNAAEIAGLNFQETTFDILNVAFLFAFMLFTIHRVRELNAIMNTNAVNTAAPVVAAAPFYVNAPAAAAWQNAAPVQNNQPVFNQPVTPVQNVQPVAPAPAPAPAPEPVQVIPETIDLNPGEVMYTAEETAEDITKQAESTVDAAVENVTDAGEEAVEEAAAAVAENVNDAAESVADSVSDAAEEITDNVADEAQVVLDAAETGLKEIKDDVDPAEAEKLAELAKMYEDM